MATPDDVDMAMQKRNALIEEFGRVYEAQRDDKMGMLHNQFVVFISTSQLPLADVLIVLEILIHETVEQARNQYLGGS